MEPYSGSENQLSRNQPGPPHGALQSWSIAEADSDLHRGSNGKAQREGIVSSEQAAIAAFIKSYAPNVVRIGLEIGPTATWLWTELRKQGLPVICIDARSCCDRRWRGSCRVQRAALPPPTQCHWWHL